MGILNVKLQSLDEKTMYSAVARDNPDIAIDYFPPIGSGKGYTSLELFLASFVSCVCSTVLSLLRYRMKKSIKGVTAEAQGTVREEHPKALKHILLTLSLNSDEVTKEEAYDALKVAEEKMCPVWSMIKGNVEVEVQIIVEKY